MSNVNGSSLIMSKTTATWTTIVMLTTVHITKKDIECCSKTTSIHVIVSRIEILSGVGWRRMRHKLRERRTWRSSSFRICEQSEAPSELALAAYKHHDGHSFLKHGTQTSTTTMTTTRHRTKSCCSPGGGRMFGRRWYRRWARVILGFNFDFAGAT